MPAGSPIFYPASPIAIRDGTAARVATVQGLTQVFKARTMPGQDDQLPYAVVWYQGERTQAWGDPNVGAPSFAHTLTLVIDVFANAGTEAALDTEIVNLVETIRATLLTDATWVQLFEGIERVDTKYAYPKESSDILVQAMIEIEVSYKSEWPPVVVNNLNEIGVTVDPRQTERWTCRYCEAVNPGHLDCRRCGAAAPIATTFSADIQLQG